MKHRVAWWSACTMAWIAFSAAWGAQPTPATGHTDSTRRVIRQIVDEALDSAPDKNPILRTIRRDFPEEYEKLIIAMADGGMRGGDDAALAAINQQVPAFIHAQSENISNAPAEALTKVIGAHLALLRLLERKDPSACGALVSTGIPAHRVLPPEADEAITNESIMLIE